MSGPPPPHAADVVPPHASTVVTTAGPGAPDGPGVFQLAVEVDVGRRNRCI